MLRSLVFGALSDVVEGDAGLWEGQGSNRRAGSGAEDER
jgi:hypothetical protein